MNIVEKSCNKIREVAGGVCARIDINGICVCIQSRGVRRDTFEGTGFSSSSSTYQYNGLAVITREILIDLFVRSSFLLVIVFLQDIIDGACVIEKVFGDVVETAFDD